MKKLGLLLFLAINFDAYSQRDMYGLDTIPLGDVAAMKKNFADRMNISISEVKTECHYRINRVDPISGKLNIVTKPYSLYSGTFDLGRFNVSIEKNGTNKYLIIYSNDNVGCASPYSSNRSKVVFKLENGQLVNFYHRGDIDCGDFRLFASLTQADIVKLKSSPIVMVRVYGTKYYSDIDNLIWKDFFIDKLDCIENTP